MPGNDTAIFVCCHGPSRLPREYRYPPYILVGAGGYRGPSIALSDDTGDNISAYNRYLNEMSVIYWVARNFSALPAFVGFAMYRHHLDCPQCKCKGGTITCVERTYGETVGDQFRRSHGELPLTRMIARLKDELPATGEALEHYMDNEHKFYKGNMFIMPRDMFFDYFGFMQVCIRIAISLVHELDIGHKYADRTCGYLLERMTSFWLWRQFSCGRAALDAVRMFHLPVRRIPLSAASVPEVSGR